MPLAVDVSGLVQGGAAAGQIAEQRYATNQNTALAQAKLQLDQAQLQRQDALLNMQKADMDFQHNATTLQYQFQQQKFLQDQSNFLKNYSLQKQQLGVQQEQVEGQLGIQQAQVGLQAQGQQIQSGQFQQTLGLQQQQQQIGQQQFAVSTNLQQQQLNKPMSAVGGFLYDLNKQTPENQDLMTNLYNRGMIKIPDGYQYTTSANGEPAIKPVEGFTATSNMEPGNAAKISSLQASQAELPKILPALIDPNGDVNRTTLFAAKGSVYYSQGRDVQSALQRAATGVAQAISPRSASPQMIDAKAATFLPQPGDSNNEIKSKINYLNTTIDSSLKLINGSTPAQTQVSTGQETKTAAQYTPQDIAYTAQKYGMTEAQVKAKLGIK